ncbi:MAG: Gfo/Idh/MocA family oxidoreductase [Pseudomonadota bacterium]
MSKQIRWGLVGTGMITRRFAADLKHSQTGVATAVASRTRANAEGLIAEFAPGAVACSFDDLLARDDVDVVFLGTPNDAHAPLMKAAIGAGKPVLCEKPFVLDAAEAEEVAEAARAAGVFCMEAMWSRFIPAVQELKARVAAGEIGEVKHFRAALGMPSDLTTPSRLTSSAQGGGALMDLGVYGVSLADYILGPGALVAARGRMIGEGVDSDCMLQMRHGSGVLSHVSASLSCELENVLEVAGDRGRLVLESPFINAVRLRHTAFGPPRPGKDSDGAVKTLLKRSGLWPLARKIARTATGMDGRSKALTYVGIGLHFQIDHVAACLAGGKLESEVMPLDASCRVMRIIDAARAEMVASDQTPPAT